MARLLSNRKSSRVMFGQTTVRSQRRLLSHVAVAFIVVGAPLLMTATASAQVSVSSVVTQTVDPAALAAGMMVTSAEDHKGSLHIVHHRVERPEDAPRLVAQLKTQG